MVRRAPAGYSLLILMVFISILLLGMMIAFPVLETQSWREKEEELLFRGGQYVEAVRLYMRNNPGNFPESIDELVKSRYLRKAFPDPMTKDGKWNLILMADAVGGPSGPSSARSQAMPAAGRTGGRTPAPGAAPTVSVQRVMIVPQSSLRSVARPRIIGVASASERKSFFIFDDNETYDTWLFYYGRSKGAKPEVILFGEAKKK